MLVLPSGLSVRGRSLRAGAPSVAPDFGLYLSRVRPSVPWPSDCIEWRDFWVPSNFEQARAAIRRAYELASSKRVEVACGGGKGRTGTTLACMAVLDGVPASQAVEFVRHHYDRRAVETPWQRRWVRRFANSV